MEGSLMSQMAPANPGTAQTQRIARELLAAQADIRARAMHNGYFAKLAYDTGIPVTEIAQTYGITLDAAYKMLRRVPACQGTHCANDTCTQCGTVSEVA